jgi:hypothetical protein
MRTVKRRCSAVSISGSIVGYKNTHITLFSIELSLRLSRACLGKMMHF